MVVATYTDQAVAPEWVAGSRELALDIETTGLDPWSDRIAVITIRGETGETSVIRTHSGVVPEWLREKLSDRTVRVIGHNLIGFDALFLDEAGVDLTKCSIYDTMVGELVTLTSGRRDVSVSLKATVKRRTGAQLNKEIDQHHWDVEELSEEQIAYVHGDVFQLHQLKDEQLAKVHGTPREQAMYFEQALVPTTIRMALNGFPLDVEKLEFMIGECWGQLADLEPKIEARLGVVNMRSPAQLKRALHAAGIMVPNTRKETFKLLEYWAEDLSAFAKDFLAYRRADQRVKVWNDEWVNKYVKADGRIHPRFWQCGTDTFRYSSSDPNAQQVAVDLRPAFGGVPGYKVVTCDYSQLEVRVGAALANDRALLAAISESDVHAAVAAQVFGIPVHEVTKAKRRLAKDMNFLFLFCGGWQGFYDYCQISGSNFTLEECKQFLWQYLGAYPGVDRMRRAAGQMARSGRPITLTLPTGHQRTLFGKKLGPTRIVNTSVQGTAAVGIKRSMMLATERGLGEYLCLQVHDELDGVVPATDAKDYGFELKRCMIEGMGEVLPRGVPIEVEVRTGDYWS